MRPEPHRLRLAGLAAALASLAALAACGGGTIVLRADRRGAARLRDRRASGPPGRGGEHHPDCMKARASTTSRRPAGPAGRAGRAGRDEQGGLREAVRLRHHDAVRAAQAAVAGPNEAIRNSLSEADRNAYDQALYGDDPTATFADALDTGDYSRLGGCIKEADATRYSAAPTCSRACRTSSTSSTRRSWRTPRMVKASAIGRSACARPASTSPSRRRWTLSCERARGDRRSARERPERRDYDKAALAALQAKEVAMVTADIECEEEHIRSVEEKVRSRVRGGLPGGERRPAVQGAGAVIEAPAEDVDATDGLVARAGGRARRGLTDVRCRPAGPRPAGRGSDDLAGRMGGHRRPVRVG